MRHHKKGRAFGKVDKVRKALLRGLARNLIIKEKIETTESKAKEIRPYIEKLISRARHDTLTSRRLVKDKVSAHKIIVEKLFKQIAPRYLNRAGGYTRIIKLPPRLKDSSKRAIIEFV